MKYKIDELYQKNGKVHIKGWAIPTQKANSTAIIIRNKAKQELPSEIHHVVRPDVGISHFADRNADMFGFYIITELDETERIFITVREIDHDSKKPVNSLTIRLTKSAILLNTLLEKHNIMSNFRAFNRDVVHTLILKIKHKDKNNYQNWYNIKKPTQETLQEQATYPFSLKPKFSIIVPVYNTPLNFLKDMIQSVQNQSYSNWELCIANASSNNQELNKVLKGYAQKDSRIKWVALKANKGISENSNAAIALASGDFIALLDHDDILAPNALFEYTKAINENPNIDVLYSDEDKIDQKGQKHYDPYFKTDFNLELLRSNNYICHFLAVRKSIVDQFGGFRSEYDGAQDHDFILRSVELTNEIYHCPKILYHWRSHTHSTAANPENKHYAYEAGQRAIQDHFKRLGMDVTTEIGNVLGWYRNQYHLPSHPSVTIMIPNKDHHKDLDKCISSIYNKSTYDNFDILVIENNSIEPETFAYYEEAKKKHSNFSVVTWEGPFNYAAINNFGARYAKGEYLLLLNNDTEVISPDFLEKMLGICMQDRTGIVGAQLYYDDDTIQHAGVLIGIGGCAIHRFYGMKRGVICDFNRNGCTQNISAVTGACLLIKHSVFNLVHGLDEQLAVAFNDIDLCLRVSQAGYAVAYHPEVELYHYESKSRGYEDTPEKIERFNKENVFFNKRWAEIIEKGDPYYNINLSRQNPNYILDPVN
ncbi:MAG: glycosyltransferase [Lachnospiraceae bacterium]